MNATPILNAVWDTSLTVLVAMLPFVVAYLAPKAAALLKINTETELYQSLYRTIENVLRALLVANGGSAARLPVDMIVEQAVDLVKANNPKAVSQLGQTADDLRTKVLAKLPDAQVKVAEGAAAKVGPTT